MCVRSVLMLVLHFCKEPRIWVQRLFHRLRQTKLINQLHGAEFFLRNQQLLSHSRNSRHLIERDGSLRCSPKPATSLYLEPDSSSLHHPILFLFRHILILSSHLRLGPPAVSFLFVSHQNPVCVPLLSHVCFMRSLELCLVRSTSYEAPHSAVFSSLLLFQSSWVQLFSSAPCSQNYGFVYFNLLFISSRIKF
jgi:hypothetical protein